MSTQTATVIGEATFHEDVNYIESLWQRRPVGTTDMPIIDIGKGEPLVFVPILEHLEFVYTRQIREFSRTRRVIMYRRTESRNRFVGLEERAEELRAVLDSLGLGQVDFVGHGDAAMVLFEFATRYPERCRSLVIVAQAADYQIAPHPFIWCLHELYYRLPVERFLPASFIRRTVVNYITARQHNEGGQDESATGLDKSVPTVRILPRALIEEQFGKIAQWPFVYRFSVIPVIHGFDMRNRLDALTMPILLINRTDDALSPEKKTHWLSEHLPNCAGYHVVPGGERFFMYSEPEPVNERITQFLSSLSDRVV